MGETLVCPVPKDAPQPPKEHFRHGKREGWWTYKDAWGSVLKIVMRFPDPDRGKVILPFTLWKLDDGKLIWKQKDLPAPRPLYGLDLLAARPDAPVLICEGEKATDAAAKHFKEFVCMTSGSATSAKHTDWRPLEDRQIVIWPDADEPGSRYASEVAEALQGIAKEIRCVTLSEGLPQGWDVADELPECWTLDTLPQLIQEAKPVPAERIVESSRPAWIIGDTARYLREEPPPVRWIVEGLIPAGVPGVFVARAGAGKSMTALLIGMGLSSGLGVLGRSVSHDASPGVVYVGMEDDEPEFHRRYRRALDLFRDDSLWSPAYENRLPNRFIPLFPNFDSGAVFRLELQADAIRDIANAIPGGCGLIILDTLSRLSHGDENSSEGTRPFLEAQSKLVQLTGATVMAIHHVRKGNDVSSDHPLWHRLDLENMRGSSAIEGTIRFGITMAALKAEEAERVGLDLEKAQRGGYVALHLGKMSHVEHGSTVLLERRTSGEVGAGFLCPHDDSERILAALRSEASMKKLILADKVLLAIAEAGGLNGLDQAEKAMELWPTSKSPEGQWRKKLSELRGMGFLSDPKLTPAGLARAGTLGFCSARNNETFIHEPETQCPSHCSAGTSEPEQTEQDVREVVPSMPVPYRRVERMEQSPEERWEI
ncbi:MAG: AAA family ATPase [Holophagaceae bacterium]|nr:AAA family ATPase [Holophagaceae bacterium]